MKSAKVQSSETLENGVEYYYKGGRTALGKDQMFHQSEIRAYAQDAVIALADASEDPESNLVYTGRYVISGAISSVYPWNADNAFKRSFPAQDPVLVVYVDCSVPGSGFGVWAAKAPGSGWVFDESMEFVLDAVVSPV